MFIIIVFLWTLPWKAYALWLAAKRNHKIWFIVLIILNTLAILEIYYIFRVAKKSWPEVKYDFRHALDKLKKKD